MSRIDAPGRGAIPAVCDRFPRTDELLHAFSSVLGDDFAAYRNHVCRVLNYFRALAGPDAMPSDAVLVAAAFHDIGIWTDATFDYLAPSIDHAAAHLRAHHEADLVDAVSTIIAEHHKLRPYRGPHAADVETFRRADLVDVSLGLVRFGLPRAFVRAVRSTFPNAGFHRRLLGLTARQLVRSPWRPLPMVRW